MRTSKYQIFLNFVLGLLLLNSLVVIACIYLLFYQPSTLDEWGRIYASAIRETHAVELRKIERIAVEDSSEAIERAKKLEGKLEGVAFNDFLWKTVDQIYRPWQTCTGHQSSIRNQQRF